MNSLSWRKLVGGSGALFLVIGAVLAGRVNAGSDPALKKTANTQAKAPTTQTPATPQPTQTTTGSGYDDGLGSTSGSSSSSSGTAATTRQQAPTTTRAS